MDNLDELIVRYATNKSEFDSYKKIVDSENMQIKSIMLSSNLDTHEAGGYKATCTVSKKYNMDENMLLSFFENVPAFVDIASEFGIVKTKTYIDFDALENALYHSAFSADQLNDLDKAREVKEIVTLRITKIKGKGKEKD